ncbi:YncE family protein [Paludibaculum fermentans]|uniref:YncE family protein n=1 Tax=Paludibaculum fermentans TaxID=1473598 RepID=UPI003EBF2A39
MMWKTGCVLAFTGLLTAAPLPGAETPATALLVLSKSDQTLAIVDPGNHQVVAKIPSGPDPHEVVASADGRLAFISNYGGGRYNTITVVDLVGQKVQSTVDLGALRGPHGLDFQGGKVWFTAETAKVIGSYDPVSQKIDLVLGTGQNRTHMIAVARDLKWIVTSNVNSATMTFIEKSSARVGTGGPAGAMGPAPQEWEETVVAVGRGAEGFDISPDGAELWAANALDGTISLLDVGSKKVLHTLAAEVAGANRLKFTPDGQLVFVSTLRGPELTILDARTRRTLKRVRMGRGAAGIQMEPGGARAYVACTPDDYVAIVDLKTLEVTGRLEVGKQPDGMAWAVRGQ